jgi:hypothetical protein
MSAVTWTQTQYLQWVKRPTPVGTTLPAGAQLEMLQQWYVSSDGQGRWQELPVRFWGEVYANPPTSV